MRNDWILDVIRDLRSFAALNGLDHLAAKLDETSDVARAELDLAGVAAGLDMAGLSAEPDPRPRNGN